MSRRQWRGFFPKESLLQGAVLGSALLTLCPKSLPDTISKVDAVVPIYDHKFPDDNQLHRSSAPIDFLSLTVAVQQCLIAGK